MAATWTKHRKGYKSPPTNINFYKDKLFDTVVHYLEMCSHGGKNCGSCTAYYKCHSYWDNNVSRQDLSYFIPKLAARHILKLAWIKKTEVVSKTASFANEPPE